MRQLVDVCHIHQRHLSGVLEEIANPLTARIPPGVLVLPLAPAVLPPHVDIGPEPASPRVSRRVCWRAGCEATVPAGCSVQFCADHCASQRCQIHGQRSSAQDCRCSRGCTAVPEECASVFLPNPLQMFPMSCTSTSSFGCTGAGIARRQCSEASLEQARRRKDRTHPQMAQPHGRAKLVVLGCEVGGRWPKEARKFFYSIAPMRRPGQRPKFSGCRPC